RRDVRSDAQDLAGEGVDDEQVLMGPAARPGSGPAEAAATEVVAQVEGLPRQRRALSTRAAGQDGGAGGEVDEQPVPEPARRRGVRVEAGDREAASGVRESPPPQLGRTILTGQAESVVQMAG